MTQDPKSKPQFHPIDFDRENELTNTVVSFEDGRSLLKLNFLVSVIRSAFFRQGEGLKKFLEECRRQYNCLVPGNNQRGIYNWFVEGVDCEILQPGKPWKKGKIRFRLVLEFAPDEPEPSDPNSTLDDIRKMGDG
jgi:hypothetical protein